MSKTMSLRLSDEQLATVEQIKRRYHQPSISSTLQLLLGEKIREIAHPHIVFREAAGRVAFVEGTGLSVWEIMMVGRNYDFDSKRTAKHLQIHDWLVEVAFTYAREYPDEVNARLAENDAMDFESLKRMLPQARETVVPDDYDPLVGVESAS